ncbi:MAG: Wzz/FepE/Etk N-terminal domain-containing protein, partial [Gemmatimonadales bacterium]
MAGKLIPSSDPTTIDAQREATALQAGGAYPMAPVESPDGIQWSRYLSALARYKWLILLITLVGTGLGVVITRFIKPEYITRSTITIQSGGGQNGPIRSAALIGGTGWIELMRSFAVIDSVVQHEALFASPDNPEDGPLFRGMRVTNKLIPGNYELQVSGDGKAWALLDEDGRTIDTGAPGDSIGRTVGFRWQPAPGMLGSNRTIKFDITTPRDASTDLQKNLNTSLPEESNFLRVSLSGTNPRRIARTLNAIDTQFVTLAAQLKRAHLTEMTKILAAQTDSANKHLQEAEARLQSYRTRIITLPSENGFAVAPGIQTTQAPAISDYFQKKVQLEQLRHDRQALQAALSRAQSGNLSVDAFQTIGAAQSSPNLTGALQELSAKEAELRALRRLYTEEHKPVQMVEQQMDTLRTQTIPQYVSTLINELGNREQALQNEIDTRSA